MRIDCIIIVKASSGILYNGYYCRTNSNFPIDGNYNSSTKQKGKIKHFINYANTSSNLYSYNDNHRYVVYDKAKKLSCASSSFHCVINVLHVRETRLCINVTYFEPENDE